MVPVKFRRRTFAKVFWRPNNSASEQSPVKYLYHLESTQTIFLSKQFSSWDFFILGRKLFGGKWSFKTIPL